MDGANEVLQYLQVDSEATKGPKLQLQSPRASKSPKACQEHQDNRILSATRNASQTKENTPFLMRRKQDIFTSL